MKTVQTTAGPVKCRLYDLYGRRATTTVEIANHYARLLKGTSVKVGPYGCHGMVGIEADACPHCKLQARVTNVDPERELLFEPFEHDPGKGKRR